MVDSGNNNSLFPEVYEHGSTRPEGTPRRDICYHVGPRGCNHATEDLPSRQGSSFISNNTLDHRPEVSSPAHPSLVESPHESSEVVASIDTGAYPNTSSTVRIQTHQLTRGVAASSARLKVPQAFSLVFILRAIKSSYAHIRSSLDTKTAIRFVVVIFSYAMGIATAYSVGKAPGRPDDALPSIGDDGFPMMIAQAAASLLSPLLFTIISTSDNSTPLRQKVVSFYYILLVVGVLMSFVSLLLYSLWPPGYRVTNATIMASLMFTVLGGWQFLEKCWNGAAATLGASEDIELGSR